MNKKLIGIIILKAPLVLTILGSLLVSAYASYKHLYNISYISPIFFAIILILYVIGEYLQNRKSK